MKIVDVLKNLGLMNATTTVIAPTIGPSPSKSKDFSVATSNATKSLDTEIERIYDPQSFPRNHQPHQWGNPGSTASLGIYNQLLAALPSGMNPVYINPQNYNNPPISNYDYSSGTSGGGGGDGNAHNDSENGGNEPDHAEYNHANEYGNAPITPQNPGYIGNIGYQAPAVPIPPYHYAATNSYHGVPIVPAGYSSHKKRKKSNSGDGGRSSVMNALTLLSFFFFVNLLQDCLKEHMNDLNPTIMVMTANAAGKDRFDKLAEMNSREQFSSLSSSPTKTPLSSPSTSIATGTTKTTATTQLPSTIFSPASIIIRNSHSHTSPISSSISLSSSSSSPAQSSFATALIPQTYRQSNIHDVDYSSSSVLLSSSSSKRHNENENSKIQFHNQDPEPEYYNSNFYPNHMLLAMSSTGDDNYHRPYQQSNPQHQTYRYRDRSSSLQGSSSYTSASLPVNIGGNNYFDRPDSFYVRIN